MKVVYSVDEDGIVEAELKWHDHKNTDEIHYVFFTEEGLDLNRIPGKYYWNTKEFENFHKLLENKKFFWHCNHSDPYIGNKNYHVTWPDLDMLLAMQPTIERQQEPEHLFLCQMRSVGYHRDFLIESLYNNKLFKKGLISYKEEQNDAWDHLIEKYQNDSKNATFHKQWRRKVKKFFAPDEFRLDLVYDFEDNPPPPIRLWHKCCFNIVTESYFDVEVNDNSLLTEKTYSCLLHKQPFVIVGCKNANKLLTQDGYKLYDNVFDYSFDAMDTIEERIEHLVMQIKKLDKNIYTDLQKVAVHNHNIFLKNVKNVKLPDIFFDQDTMWYPTALQQKEKILKLKSYVDNLQNVC